MAEITDPELLEQLNSPVEVTDPKLLAQLNGELPPPPTTTGDEPEAFTATFLPFSFDPAKDRGHDEAVKASGMAGPTAGRLPAYLAARGLSLAVPKFITDTLEANDRGIAGGYATGEDGNRQRAQDALTVAGSMIGLPPGASAAAKVIPAAVKEIPAVAGGPATHGAVPVAAGVGSREAALQAAERIGVDVPRAAAGGYVARSTGAALRDVPVVGDPLVKASERALVQIEGVANKVADDLGGSSTLSAGYAAKDAITGWIEAGSKADAAEIYAPVRALISDTKGPLTSASFVAQQIRSHAEEIGLKAPSVVQEIERAAAMGERSFDQIQRLRTEIGDRMSGAIVPEPGQNEKALKALYGALSEDLDGLAAKAGDKAKAAWSQANDVFRRQIADKRKKLVKIVDVDGEANAETVAQRLTQMAAAKRGADIERLRAARETMGDDAWGELGSAVVANMGRSKDGFSLARFRTDYAKLSGDGKALLFTPEHRQALDDIATVSKSFEQLDRLANHSRTAVSGSIFGAGYAAITSPMQVLASMLGGRALATVLARPATAKSTAAYARSWAAAEKTPTEETYLALGAASRRLRDALERERIPVYPGVNALLTDRVTATDDADETQ
ncbi:hypothetical protein [Hyphomicrobium sp. D-2]|uniref:hypothetical protein n=1 Tax=Hyphomicrobium sp. D-2 TaxID=3041621 RepID=UPI00245516DC|nr:hypothetical protein [Hyphomicrobium sp. D-2]MDH4981465.1 hypothetical protein [Hyphomicrobium sp. D-2]